jgi:hypothetical protein
MDATAPPTLDATLTELASLGMRAVRAVTRMLEIEVQAAELVAGALPELGREANSLGEAVADGQGIDAANAAMAQAVPRTEILALAHDRLTRSVRRSVALLRRIEAGWPRAGSARDRADDRTAMVRRQVARGVGEAIRRQADGEAAERLFDELTERLDQLDQDEIGTIPVAEVIARICRELGLVTQTLEAGLPGGTGAPWPGIDTG